MQATYDIVTSSEEIIRDLCERPDHLALWLADKENEGDLEASRIMDAMAEKPSSIRGDVFRSEDGTRFKLRLSVDL